MVEEVPSSISLYTQVIKEQNIQLLNWISQYKGLNEMESTELFDKFLKVNYYCPDIVSDKKFKSIYN